MTAGRLFVAVFVTVVVCAGSFAPANTCSLFSLNKPNEMVFGRNLDWQAPFPGYVVVNKRGVPKEILPWKGWWPGSPRSETVSWVAKYGSISFTCFGRDFIESGMNEKGLTVGEASLEAIYPPDDGRPGVSCTQWLQYQLDNFATVDEVLEHLGDLRPDGEGLHYLISDATGACAIIEYLDGKPTIFVGDDLEVRALTNTTHRRAMNHAAMDNKFGGEVDISSGSDSYGRFVGVAAMMRDYNQERDGSGESYAFRILDTVSCDATLRSVVYDVARGRVTWKTPGNTARRWLDFEGLDLSLEGPTQIVDVEAGGPGDVAGLLEDFTFERNRAIVETILGDARENPEIRSELESRGLTVDEALELISRNPKDPSGGKKQKGNP